MISCCDHSLAPETSRDRSADYSARSVASGLSSEHVALATTPMTDQQRGQQRTCRQHQRRRMPFDFEHEPARPPSSGPAHRAAPTMPASRPSALYSSASIVAEQPRAGAERAQDGGLVDALELRHRDRADQDQDAARRARSPPTIEIASVTLSRTRLDRRDDLTDVDRRDVRERGDQIALEARPRRLSPRAHAGCRCSCAARARAAPGRNTNMKPPVRASSHLTSRTLVTRAWIARPRTSKRI